MFYFRCPNWLYLILERTPLVTDLDMVALSSFHHCSTYLRSGSQLEAVSLMKMMTTRGTLAMTYFQIMILYSALK